jgi:ketol-acid reductoisomerase
VGVVYQRMTRNAATTRAIAAATATGATHAGVRLTGFRTGLRTGLCAEARLLLIRPP